MTEQEARDEAERRWPQVEGTHSTDDVAEGFVLGAAWERSRLSSRVVEAAPSVAAWLERVNRALWQYDQGALDVRGVAEALASQPVQVEVTTVEELEALPVGSVVRLAPEDSLRVDLTDGSWEQGAVAEKRPDLAGVPAWFLVGKSLGYRSHQADLLPATVLYQPADALSRTSQPVRVEDAEAGSEWDESEWDAAVTRFFGQDVPHTILTEAVVNARGGSHAEFFAALSRLVLSIQAEPRKVEVTDDMVERAARALGEFITHGGVDDLSGPNGEYWIREARAVLSAALGGGDQ